MRKIFLAAGVLIMAVIAVAFFSGNSQKQAPTCPPQKLECCKKPSKDATDNQVIWESLSRQFI